MTIRTAAMTITRVGSDGAAPASDSFAEDGRIISKANNIVLSRIVHPHTEFFGEIGPEQDWDRTVSLTNLTFDLMEATEAPEALGPVELYFDIVEKMTNGKNRKHRIGGRIQETGGTFNRAQEYPRSLTIVPFLLIVGGGATLADDQLAITRPTPGTASDAVAFAYCRLRAAGAEAAEYITRRPGQAPIEHLPL